MLGDLVGKRRLTAPWRTEQDHQFARLEAAAYRSIQIDQARCYALATLPDFIPIAAGEIGQVMVGTDAGPEAPYDRERCLEAWLAVPRLEARVAAAGAAGEPVDPVLREAGQRLGVALAPIVGALNLSEVVLSGPEELIDGVLLDAVGETLRNRTMAGFHSGVAIRMTGLGRDIVLRGCVVMVLSAQLGVS